MRRVVSLLFTAWLLAPLPAVAEAEPEDLRSAKTLFFDRRYAESREAWQGVLESGNGGGAAAYWIARCSEQLGESDRAVAEYTSFLASQPRDPSLAEEARVARIGIACRLYREGRRQHLALVRQGLSDPSRTVRIYAAFQLAGLGPKVGRPAVPVLRQILSEEKDPDIVERAKLSLLRIDPSALTPPSGPRPRSKTAEVAWIKVRIQEAGAKNPKVSINVPLSLAELAFKSLPDDVKTELRRKGYAADSFWRRLKDMGPSEIISIEGENGETVRVWTE